MKHKKVKTVGRNALTTVRKFFPSVSRVLDADENLLIDVTAADEKISRKGDHAECAMAIACKRKLKVSGVIMARSIAYLIKNDVATRYSVPGSVSREITSFDRGGGFEAGTYELVKPTPSARLDAQESKGYTDGPSKQKPTFRHLTANIRAVIGAKQ